MSKKYKIKFECGEHPKFKAKKYKTKEKALKKAEERSYMSVINIYYKKKLIAHYNNGCFFDN